MELILERTYHLQGTNGSIYHGGQYVCHTIELPWLNNRRGISCIPEGRYVLEKRFSPRFQWHMLVRDVPGRSAILIHPANLAARELKGCIAPVMRLQAPGKGLQSRHAMGLLQALIFPVLEERIPVFLTIQPSEDENK